MQMKKSAHCAKLFGKKIPAAFIKKVVASPASALVEATNHHLRSSLDFIISFKFKWLRLFLAQSSLSPTDRNPERPLSTPRT